MHKFFKIPSSMYDEIRNGIDQALYDKYIVTQKFEYILPPTSELIYNDYIYFVLNDYIYSDILIENYINQLIEITELEYTRAIESITLL